MKLLTFSLIALLSASPLYVAAMEKEDVPAKAPKARITKPRAKNSTEQQAIQKIKPGMLAVIEKKKNQHRLKIFDQNGHIIYDHPTEFETISSGFAGRNGEASIRGNLPKTLFSASPENIRLIHNNGEENITISKSNNINIQLSNGGKNIRLYSSGSIHIGPSFGASFDDLIALPQL